MTEVVNSPDYQRHDALMREIYKAARAVVEETSPIARKRETKAEDYQPMSAVEVARCQFALKQVADTLSEAMKNLNEEYDYVRKAALPEAMERDDLEEGFKVAGVGRVNLQADVYASVPAADFENFVMWLDENDMGDMVKQTINASTLKAWARAQLREGTELPEEIKVTPYSYAKITKS